MIENILIVDTETSGLDPKKERCIEFGAILYNIQERGILQSCSSLLPCDINPVEHINKISPLLTKKSYSLHFAKEMMRAMINECQAIVAHNAQFDRPFLELVFPGVISHKWICTKNDFKWPVNPPRKRLQDFCEAMHVPYQFAHRALSDCNLIVQCFNKIDDLEVRFNDCAKPKNIDMIKETKDE